MRKQRKKHFFRIEGKQICFRFALKHFIFGSLQFSIFRINAKTSENDGAP
jgi:hypothetical protein